MFFLIIIYLTILLGRNPTPNTVIQAMVEIYWMENSDISNEINQNENLNISKLITIPIYNLCLSNPDISICYTYPISSKLNKSLSSSSNTSFTHTTTSKSTLTTSQSTLTAFIAVASTQSNTILIYSVNIRSKDTNVSIYKEHTLPGVQVCIYIYMYIYRYT
jgi:hypothetical protein